MLNRYTSVDQYKAHRLQKKKKIHRTKMKIDLEECFVAENIIHQQETKSTDFFLYSSANLQHEVAINIRSSKIRVNKETAKRYLLLKNHIVISLYLIKFLRLRPPFQIQTKQHQAPSSKRFLESWLTRSNHCSDLIAISSTI